MTEQRFEFGKNWKRFVDVSFSEEKAALSKKSLCSFLGVSSLKGYSFLDIGCGSGLSSLAAVRAGADRVVSFDYDADSVAASRRLYAASGCPSHWTIMRGDILDADFIAKLGTFDIVYSWGVLHHTGNMHKAILNALQTLNDSGALFIALYSYSAYMNGTASGRPSPEEWLRIKQRYLNSSRLGRFFMEMEYLWQRYAAPAKGNPRKLLDGIREFHQHWRNYGARSRGMDFWTDIRDWLGGWPMEFVREEELLPQMEEQGLELLRMDTGRGNTEFLFQKRGKGHLWKFALESRALTPLPGPFESMGDHVYKARLPHLRHEANTAGFPLRSRLRVLENGNWLPFANAPLPALRAYAHGRYQHWEDQLYFSAPDNSDPNTNGRTYTYFIDKRE